MGIAQLEFTITGLGMSTEAQLLGTSCPNDATTDDDCDKVLKLDDANGFLESIEQQSHVWVGGQMKLSAGLALGALLLLGVPAPRSAV